MHSKPRTNHIQWKNTSCKWCHIFRRHLWQETRILTTYQILKTKMPKSLRCLQFWIPEWGGDTNILLQLSGSMIRSKLDYACQVFGSAKPSYLKMLNTIHNQGLHLATGAFRTSAETSLHVETNTIPLELRRKQLTLQLQQKKNTHIAQRRLQLPLPNVRNNSPKKKRTN